MIKVAIIIITKKERQKYGHKTIMGRGVGSFWRVRDNTGSYYE